MELRGSLKKWVTSIDGRTDEVGPTLWGCQDDHAAGRF